jgi:hypothetical protein
MLVKKGPVETLPIENRGSDAFGSVTPHELVLVWVWPRWWRGSLLVMPQEMLVLIMPPDALKPRKKSGTNAIGLAFLTRSP